MYRRYFKFCQQCGICGRNDNLKKLHIPVCQPNLKKGQTGFLKEGEFPVVGRVDFEMNLRLISTIQANYTSNQTPERIAETSNNG